MTDTILKERLKDLRYNKSIIFKNSFETRRKLDLGEKVKIKFDYNLLRNYNEPLNTKASLFKGKEKDEKFIIQYFDSILDSYFEYLNSKENYKVYKIITEKDLTEEEKYTIFLLNFIFIHMPRVDSLIGTIIEEKDIFSKYFLNNFIYMEENTNVKKLKDISEEEVKIVVNEICENVIKFEKFKRRKNKFSLNDYKKVYKHIKDFLINNVSLLDNELIELLVVEDTLEYNWYYATSSSCLECIFVKLLKENNDFMEEKEYFLNNKYYWNRNEIEIINYLNETEVLKKYLNLDKTEVLKKFLNIYNNYIEFDNYCYENSFQKILENIINLKYNLDSIKIYLELNNNEKYIEYNKRIKELIELMLDYITNNIEHYDVWINGIIELGSKSEKRIKNDSSPYLIQDLIETYIHNPNFILYILIKKRILKDIENNIDIVEKYKITNENLTTMLFEI